MAFVLEGIKVVQTASTIAGPMTGRLLADWGADVIGVENPIRGSKYRSQYAMRQIGRAITSDIEYRSENINRNKRDITLDLSQKEGQKIIHKMLEKADIHLSNFRPRELKKFKLEYETLSQLNPRLICANIYGYGKKGPDKDLPGTEFTGYFARSGISHTLQMPGTPPVMNPIGMGDHMAGLALAYGIMAALFMRERTGRGQEVDVSLFHTAVFNLSYDIGGSLVTGKDRQPVERRDLSNPLHNSYQTKDGRWLRLAVMEADLYWSRLCQIIEHKELEHDTRFASQKLITDNHTALFDILDEAFRSKTLDEWRVLLDEASFMWAPVQSLPEVINDPQARANDFFVSYDHPAHGRIEVVSNPVKLSEGLETENRPAPKFSQHTEEVLLEYGYTTEDIKQFKQQRIIA
ncbi:CaiB/BaiF CoA transferase family protein [Chloroflexota bacterium]